MPTFSVIIPVYNTEKYIRKCIDSVLNQTFNDYEIVVVNDGSTDKCLDILNEYDNIKLINQKNQGLSMARNTGIKSAKGKYFILLDSDDYIEPDLLYELNQSISNSPDLVRFQIQEVLDNEIRPYNEISFKGLNGKEAFSKISDFHFIECACCYLYKKSYFEENNFEFQKCLYHEDYGLIPLVIVKAGKVNCIDYIGYNYVQRFGSIMNCDDYKKIVKKAFDVLIQYKKLIQYDGGKIYKSFLANSVVLKLKDLKGEDYKNYLSELKRLRVFDNLLSDNLGRKLKKILLTISPKTYLKMR